ncbi:hypothetical protein D3C85_1653090 [compost metagenome]
MAFEGVALDLVDVGGGNHRARRQFGGHGEAGQTAGRREETGRQGVAQGEAECVHVGLSGGDQNR